MIKIIKVYWYLTWARIYAKLAASIRKTKICYRNYKVRKFANELTYVSLDLYTVADGFIRGRRWIRINR